MSEMWKTRQRGPNFKLNVLCDVDYLQMRYRGEEAMREIDRSVRK
jgi:hypothetical protein